MKRIFKAAWILAASALAFSSCVEEQNLAPQDEQADMVTINITAGSAQTKTHLDGSAQIKWDQAGEKLEVLQQQLPETSFERVTSNEGTASTDGLTSTFTATLPTATGTFGYYAVYPSTNCVTSNNTAIDSTKLEIPEVQHPISLTSFDPAADLLVSKALQATEQPAKLDFQFARPIAIMEMTVKGLGVNETIQSVEFSNSTANLSGRMYYNFPANKVFKCGYYGKKMVNCIYDKVTYNTDPQGNKIYFTVLPTDLADFKVIVTTDQATYTKEVTPLTALTINPNDLVKFSVAFTNEHRVENVKDSYTLLKDAALLSEGDKVIIVAKDKNLAMSTTDNGNNRGQVAVTITNDQITEIKPDIQILEIMPGNAPDRLSFYTGTGYLESAEGKNYLKTVTTKNDDFSSWTVTIDKTTGVATIKTCGTNRRMIKYNSSARLFGSYTSGQNDVQLFYKKGTLKTALDTPQNLYAEQEDKNVNSATVIWDEVTDAASYTVTCGENVQTVNAPETSATIAELAWGTPHTITVVANPAQGSETLKSSAAATTTVTIGENPEWKNASIKDLRAKMATQGFNLQSYGGGSITAYVAGEFSGNLSVVDNTGKAGSGIALYNYVGEANVGQRINIDLTTATIGSYKGLQQIQNAKITSTNDPVAAIVTPKITAEQLNSDAYQSMYVQIEATTPSNVGTWGMPDLKLKDQYGNINIHVSSSATFKNVEFKANTTGIIKGIASYFNAPQLQPIFESDIAAFKDTTPAISFEKTEFNLKSDVTSLKIPFTRNEFATGDVTVTVNPEAKWLTVNPTTIGGTVSEISCTFNANTGAERTATLTVKVAGNETDVHTINVTQVAKGVVVEESMTIDLTQKAGYTNATAVTTVTKEGDPITVTFNNGSNKSNAPKYYSTGDAVRMYNGNTLTISGKIITKIEFTMSSKSKYQLSFKQGTTVIDAKCNWTWSDNNGSDSVVFTGTQTTGIASIKVTYK